MISTRQDNHLRNCTGGNAMLFKTELTEVFTMAEMDKIVKALSA